MDHNGRISDMIYTIWGIAIFASVELKIIYFYFIVSIIFIVYKIEAITMIWSFCGTRPIQIKYFGLGVLLVMVECILSTNNVKI